MPLTRFNQMRRHRPIRIPVELLEALAPHAVRRGLTPGELSRLILDYVIADGLVDSVLDDDPAPARSLSA